MDFFPTVSIVVGSFECSGWYGTPSASQNHPFVFGLLSWHRTPGFVCVEPGRAGVAARAERLCAVEASGEKFFFFFFKNFFFFLRVSFIPHVPIGAKTLNQRRLNFNARFERLRERSTRGHMGKVAVLSTLIRRLLGGFFPPHPLGLENAELLLFYRQNRLMDSNQHGY